MSKRPRIEKKLIGEVIVDELAYTANKSSKNARKVFDKTEHIEIEIWCDKHYYSRANIGDTRGKREGIEENVIKDLVVKSIPHLMYYLFKVVGFKFVNYDGGTRNIRLVLQEIKKIGTLNVVVEFHHLEHNKYEVTVVTAMREDNFKISVGQNVLELEGDISHLRKNNGDTLVDIDAYSK